MHLALGVLSLALAAGLTWQAVRMIEAAGREPTNLARVIGLVVVAVFLLLFAAGLLIANRPVTVLLVWCKSCRHQAQGGPAEDDRRGHGRRAAHPAPVPLLELPQVQSDEALLRDYVVDVGYQ